MKKIALIIPYFGKFPNYFYLNLLSIAKNPEITWFFFTDDYSEYDWPSNTKVHYMSFSELQNLVQSRFDFKISLDRPYKLCDFKPAYGVIFSDYLQEYTFWGHCDLDIIWGDLKKYLTEQILTEYDFIFREGHLRLYRNIDEINYLFKKKGSIFSYKEVFSKPESYGFDEALSIQRIAERQKVKLYHDDNVVADIESFVKPLYIRRITKKRWSDEAGIFRNISNYQYQIFKWESGKIFRCYLNYGKINIDEFMYLHLMKRKMHTDQISQNAESFLIVPDAFLQENNTSALTIDSIRVLSQADNSGVKREKTIAKIIRKLKKICSLSIRERNVILKKRFYFIIEKLIF